MDQSNHGTSRTIGLVLAALVLLAIWGCSSVGPGFANHPPDCAMGIPWADCLPGTAGYNNGGGRIHREADQQRQAAFDDRVKSVVEECKAKYSNPEFEPLSHKVELWLDSIGSAPRFEVASNDTFPTEQDLPMIAKWAAICENCGQRIAAVSMPVTQTALQAANLQQDRAFFDEARALVGQLIVALYQRKLTYGEYARSRYEIGRAAVNAELKFRKDVLSADQARQEEARRQSRAEFMAMQAQWANNMALVNARRPLTVNCTSQTFGNMTHTNCQ